MRLDLAPRPGPQPRSLSPPLAVDLEGSLLLGTLERCDCSVGEFRMAENDTLLLLSDGVAEATNEKGELLGFDRALELIRSRPSAAKTTEAAQAFGQQDDSSVISVTRMPVQRLRWDDCPAMDSILDTTLPADAEKY